MSADQSPRAGHRVLVVEDDYVIADLVAMMLDDLGYDVVGPVATVPEAVSAISREKIDAVVLDGNLGGTSSAPIAEILATCRIPFIVVTGYGKSFEFASVALQAAPRLAKPFKPADFAAVLSKTLISEHFR